MPKPIRRPVAALLLAVCGLLMAPPRAHAIDPALPLSRLEQAHWTRADGAPSDPSALAQTRDGMLWIRTRPDPYLFDGAVFRAFEAAPGPRLPSSTIRSMTPDSDGGMWLGFFNGDISHVDGVDVRNDSAASGLPAGRQVRRVLRVGGQVLAATQGGLFERHGGRWQPAASAALSAGEAIDDIALDRHGSLWVLKGGQALRRAAGATRFSTLTLPLPDNTVSGLLAGADGSVWVWNMGSGANLCRIWPRDAPACWNVRDLYEPALDGNDSLWWANEQGLHRIARPARLDVRDKMAARMATETIPGHFDAVLAARDGSVFASGASGLTRVRQTPIQPVATPTGGIVAAPGSGVWLASFNRGVMRIGTRDDAAPVYVANDGTLWHGRTVAMGRARGDDMTYARTPKVVDAEEPIVLQRLADAGTGTVRIDADRNGGQWIGRMAPPALVHMQGDRTGGVALPAFDRGAILRGMQRDADGNLWIGAGLNHVTLYQQRAGQWHAYGGRAAPGVASLVAFTATVDGSVWLATGLENLVRLAPGQTTTIDARDGLDIGASSGIVAFDGQLWATGSRGIAALHAGRFITVRGMGGERFVGTSGLLQRRNGDLWLNGSDGVSLVTASQWRRALAEPGYAVRFTRLDFNNGIDSPAMQRGPYPSIAQAEDGVLWFAMRSRLYRLDPDALQPPEPAPLVIFRSVQVDGMRHPARSGLQLAPAARTVMVDFAAPGALYPERTRFRHRMAGAGGTHGGWTELGTQRQLVLPQLPPGRHVLEVAATGSDGAWAARPAVLAFEVKPSFHQTWMFATLITLAALAALLSMYLLRIRHVAKRIHAEAGVRLAERERIARDLHDTLLQGMQGLLLAFHAVAARLPAGEPLRNRMERTLQHTEDLLREGRDRVQLLRDPSASTLDLGDSLQRHAHDFALEHRMGCHVELPDPPRVLRAEVYEQMLQIGREALANAFRHSQGSTVWLALDLAQHGARLVVRDDGRGIDSQRSQGGHWGLRGMHERARMIDAHLAVSSSPGIGTTVTLEVSGHRAYPRRRDAPP